MFGTRRSRCAPRPPGARALNPAPRAPQRGCYVYDTYLDPERGE
jgi:hypothetical protein